MSSKSAETKPAIVERDGKDTTFDGTVTTKLDKGNEANKIRRMENCNLMTISNRGTEA